MEFFCSSSIAGVVSDDSVVLRAHDGVQCIAIPRAALPELIQYFENVLNSGRRDPVRISVSDVDLRITLTWKESVIPVVPRDISVIGVGVEAGQDQLEMQVDDSVLVDLRYEDQSIVLDGVVRHCTDNTIGISFPSCITDDEPDPPETLRDIVAAVQRQHVERLSDAISKLSRVGAGRPSQHGCS